MKQRRPRRIFLTTLGALGALATPRRYAAAAAEAFTMRLSMGQTVTTPMGMAATRFAQSVARRSNGQLTVEVYPSYQLAKESQTVDGLLSGFLDFVEMIPATMVSYLPRFQVLDMPFLFRDADTAYRVLDGPIGADFAAECDAKGIVSLSWGQADLREFGTTTKPIVTPEDMKGVRVRVADAAVYIATFQALGAVPVALDSSETFMAVTQHTVDATDYPLIKLVESKFYSVIKHVALMHQMASPVGLWGSKKKLATLPANLQKIVREEAKAAAPYWRQLAARETADDVEILKKNGVTFTEPAYPAFRKAVQPVYVAFQSKPGGDLIDRISRIANA